MSIVTSNQQIPRQLNNVEKLDSGVQTSYRKKQEAATEW